MNFRCMIFFIEIFDETDLGGFFDTVLAWFVSWFVSRSIPKACFPIHHFSYLRKVSRNYSSANPKITEPLVVSTHLKNLSQNGNLPQIWVNIKKKCNHQLAKPFSELSARVELCFLTFHFFPSDVHILDELHSTLSRYTPLAVGT